MEFTNTFHVPLPLEQAWPLMLDVPRILPCLPGARLTEVLGDNRYKGSISLRLGPIRLSFDGQAQLVRTDDENHVAWLEGSGIDPKGRGSARSAFSFSLARAADGGTQVTVTTQLALSGSVAQYGRGSGMIAEVASQILGQFERNLAQSLAHGGADESGMAGSGETVVPHAHAVHGAGQAGPHAAGPGIFVAPAGAAPATGAPPAQPADAQAILMQAQAVLSQAQAILALAQSRMVHARQGAATRVAPAGELNMLSIGLKAMWARVRYGVGAIFGRRP